jgi:energy-coupling factor transport system ATP-binding protein
MQLILDQVMVKRGEFSLMADGIFSPGVHLLTGRVGSGKSTLGEILGKAQKPASGRMILEGIDSSVLSMQFPEYHITTTTVLEETLSWGRDQYQVLGAAGLSGREDTDLLTLSRGELKRLHLACLLAGTYDLMILDEPFAGLDEEARHWISSHLDDHRKGITIIISHDITALPCIDHLWEIQEGLLTDIGQIPDALQAWDTAPPLIRYLLNSNSGLSGLSRIDLAEAVCRIRE